MGAGQAPSMSAGDQRDTDIAGLQNTGSGVACKVCIESCTHDPGQSRAANMGHNVLVHGISHQGRRLTVDAYCRRRDLMSPSLYQAFPQAVKF